MGDYTHVCTRTLFIHDHRKKRAYYINDTHFVILFA